MGGVVSSLPSGVKREWMDIFDCMKLTTQEVILLLQLYNRLKLENCTTINVSVLLKILDIEQTRFTIRIFSSSRQEVVGQIDFYDFVVSIWRFCSLDKPAINVFAFDIFDSDGDYTLTSEEAQEMFTDLTGHAVTTTCLEMDPDMEEIRMALVSLTKLTWDRSVNIEDFKDFTRKNPMLLSSIYTVQRKLKLATLGEGMWENIAQRRILIQPGLNIQLNELMMLHSNRQRFESLLDDRNICASIKIILRSTDNTAQTVLSLARASITTTAESDSVSLKDSGSNSSKSTKRKPKNYKKNAIQLPKNLLHHCSA